MEEKPMISCSLEKRAGEYTGLAHIVLEYMNGGEEPHIVTAPINTKNLRRHIEQCASVLVRLERLKGED